MAEEAASRRGVFVTALRRPDAAVAAIVLGLIVGAAIFAPLIAPQIRSTSRASTSSTPICRRHGWMAAIRASSSAPTRKAVTFGVRSFTAPASR